MLSRVINHLLYTRSACLASAPLYSGAASSRAPSVGLLFRFVAQRRHRAHSSVTDATHHRISLYNDGCGCEGCAGFQCPAAARLNRLCVPGILGDLSRCSCVCACACARVWLRTSQRKQSLICTVHAGPLYVTASV